jgi:simple sugar transport system permease protein
MSAIDIDWRAYRRGLIALAIGVLILVVIGFTTPWLGILLPLLSVGYFDSTIQLATPIALAGIGGLYSEKSGLINIGIEGLLIISAFTSVLIADAVSGSIQGPNAAWLGLIGAIVASTLLALLFGAICIEFKADQIIAGLAVWFVALGLAPFAAQVRWGSVTSPISPSFKRIAVPVLSEIPVLGTLFFDAYPTTYMMFLIVPTAWYVLNYTTFGMWVEASGEHPEALDTAGVDVNRIRYVSVTISGVLSGIAGTSIPLANVGQFVGQGATMINGRGFIGIVAYLMGNYNPLLTFMASALFSGLDALQIQFQQVGVNLPTNIIGIIPHVSVIVVLVLFGYTRIPSGAGENFESGEE